MTILKKIMAIGDSITYGVIGNGSTESGGYRTELWNLFTADGLATDFIGPRASGPSHIDRDHAGMRGWRTDQILYGRSTEPTAGNLDDWLNADTPDLVLLKIGTNDILQDFQLNTAPDRLSEIIDRITSKAPNAQIVVSSILPIDRTLDLQQVKTYNSFIPGIVNSKVSQGKKVSFIDMFDKLTVSDLPDQIHPSLDGYVKMGNAWYEALVPILGLDRKIRVQAEDMTLTNYRIETENPSALGRKVIGLSSSNPTGKAAFNFNGTSGNYDIIVGFYDENDGQGSLTFKAGSQLLDQWTLNKNLGSAGADSKTLQRRTVATNFFLENGTNIQIEGIANQSEFTRIDYIEFIPKESLSTASLSVENLSQGNGTTHTFTVTYTDQDGINVSSIDSSDIQVNGPNGFSQLAQLVSVNSSSNGSPRTATYRINAPGGSWDVSDNGSYQISLRSNQVADQQNNYIPAGGLGSFQVNVPQTQTPIRIEAENMQRSNYLVVSNTAASAGQLASLPVVSVPNSGTLNSTFNGASGTYDIVLRFVDENDGQAQLITKIAGNQIDSRVLNQDLGWGGVDSRTLVTQVIGTNVFVNNGDSIAIQGIAEGAEYARVDYIEFVPKENLSTASLSVENLSQGNGTTHTFTVTYTDQDGINVSSIDSSDIQVNGPNGFSQLAQLVSVNSSSNGSPRTATYRINAPGGSWDVSDNGSYQISLRSNQVADQQNNYIPAGGLGSFQVNVPQTQTPIRIEAENMQRSNYLVVSNTAASAGQLASLPVVSVPNSGTLNSTFNGASGTYDIVLRFVDENDGQAQLITKIAGNQIDSRVLNQDLGWGGVDSRTLVTQVIGTNVFVNNGDSIAIQGIAEGAEYARVDYIEFVPITPSSSSSPSSFSSFSLPSNVNNTDVVVADSLTGTSENHTTSDLEGDMDENDPLTGTSDSNPIYKMDGNDSLNNEVVNDTLIGSSGQEGVVLADGNGGDMMTNFTNFSDRFHLSSNFTFNLTLNARSGFRFNQFPIAQSTGGNLNNVMPLSHLWWKSLVSGTGYWGLGNGIDYRASTSLTNQVYF